MWVMQPHARSAGRRSAVSAAVKSLHGPDIGKCHAIARTVDPAMMMPAGGVVAAAYQADSDCFAGIEIGMIGDLTLHSRGVAGEDGIDSPFHAVAERHKIGEIKKAGAVEVLGWAGCVVEAGVRPTDVEGRPVCR